MRNGILFIIGSMVSVSLPAGGQVRPESIRIIVVDSVTGRPLENVEVLDLRTRTSLLTSKVGTIDLARVVNEAGARIELRKIGYQPATHLVTNASHDSSLTLTLAPLPQPVPGRLTSGRVGESHRGPADTLRILEFNGFYDRRLRTAAPASAFVTEEKLARLTTLANLPSLTGRGICMQNLYVDGVRYRPDRSLFSWLRPESVAAIELYSRSTEIPAQYNVTLPSGSSSSCATLVWTKR